MKLSKLPQSALIVSSTDKGAAFIAELLDSSSYDPVERADSAGEARRKMISDVYDIVVINAPLSDEFGHELALEVSEEARSVAVLLVKGDIYDQTCYRVEDSGVLTISKPVSHQAMYSALRLASAVSRRLNAAEREKEKLLVKIEELRVVDRAKWVLVEYLKMNEETAHKYIERQAMDMRITRREVAENILKMYEN
ncbi:MAG: ANTAR domain-containing protein [Eubacteriales bacterium]